MRRIIVNAFRGTVSTKPSLLGIFSNFNPGNVEGLAYKWEGGGEMGMFSDKVCLSYQFNPYRTNVENRVSS